MNTYLKLRDALGQLACATGRVLVTSHAGGRVSACRSIPKMVGGIPISVIATEWPGVASVTVDGLALRRYGDHFRPFGCPEAGNPGKFICAD